MMQQIGRPLSPTLRGCRIATKETGMDGKWIAIGVAVGVAIGVATDNLAVGTALGAAIGFVLAKTRGRRA
jgi:hypothetical protein